MLKRVWNTVFPAVCLLVGVALGWVTLSALQGITPAPSGRGQPKTASLSPAPVGPQPSLALVDALNPPGAAEGLDSESRGPPSGEIQAGRDPEDLPSNPPTRRWVRGGEPVENTAPRLAIVIDDVGHNLRQPRQFLEMGVPLTFSVLPGLRYSAQAAALIHRGGREFLIHLPMEPRAYPRMDPGPEPLLLAQDAAFTRRRMERFLGDFPNAIGASNHMGSAYTLHAEKMGIVQGMLGRRHLLFLNSRTSASPVPGQIAARGGYPFLERDVFLDNERREGAVRAELKRAVRIARENGRAVAIGHPYPETYHALKKALAHWQETGVALVPLSEVARH